MLWLFDRARLLGLIPLPRDTAQSPSPCEIARVITFLSFLRNSSAISTVYLCQKNYIRMFLGKKINEQCISIFSNLIPKLTWACFVVFIVSHLWFFFVFALSLGMPRLVHVVEMEGRLMISWCFPIVWKMWQFAATLWYTHSHFPTVTMMDNITQQVHGAVMVEIIRRCVSIANFFTASLFNQHHCITTNWTGSGNR